ncbi:MAG TPA: hypothetical protein VGC24_00535 [Burkholderiaceae bacterium]
MNTALTQLGSFIFYFQHVEGAVNELISLLSHADPDVAKILTNGLGYAQRVQAIEALFIRQEHLRGAGGGANEEKFRALCKVLLEAGTRRNYFVHSRWMHWINVEGRTGLLRRDERLHRGEAFLKEREEGLQAEDFEKDLATLETALRDLESFRLQVIDLLYPESD